MWWLGKKLTSPVCFGSATMNQLNYPARTADFFTMLAQNPDIKAFAVTNNMVHDLATYTDLCKTKKSMDGIMKFLDSNRCSFLLLCCFKTSTLLLLCCPSPSGVLTGDSKKLIVFCTAMQTWREVPQNFIPISLRERIQSATQGLRRVHCYGACKLHEDWWWFRKQLFATAVQVYDARPSLPTTLALFVALPIILVLIPLLTCFSLPVCQWVPPSLDISWFSLELTGFFPGKHLIHFLVPFSFLTLNKFT